MESRPIGADELCEGCSILYLLDASPGETGRLRDPRCKHRRRQGVLLRSQATLRPRCTVLVPSSLPDL